MADENPIYAAAETLSNYLNEEIGNLKDVSKLDDFERRTKSLTAMSKAIQTFNEFVREIRSNSKDDDGSIESVMEFREELAHRIRTLVENGKKGSK